MDEGKRPADATASRFATASRPRAVGRARRSRGRRGASPVPWWLPAVACAGVLYLVLPLVFMGMRVPWSDLPGIVSNESTVAAMELSLRTCLAAVVVDVLVGVPLAILLSREWRGVRAARILVALPLSLPPVVAGLALLTAFGRKGVLGAHMQAMGISVAFSTAAVVMAQVFVSLPFLVITLEAALRTRSRGLEETAAALGAGPSRVLWCVTLPMAVPGLARGTALALARCLGEFGATITFAGSAQGITETMPLRIYLVRVSDSDSALAVGVVLVLASACVVALTEWPARRARRYDDADRYGDRSAHPSPAVQETGEDGEGAFSADEAESARISVSGRIEARGWDVGLDVEPGEVVAVMGHNGAGKSTLAELLAGRLALDSGEVRFGDVVVDGPDAFVPSRARRVAVVSQDPRIFGHMSVLANVAFPLRCRRWPRSRAKAAARRQLRAVGCERLASRRGDELSGGQAARVALARALVFHPRLLILDEPTAALDVEATAHVSRILSSRLKHDRATTVLVTHDVAEAVELAARLVILEGGRVVEQGEPAGVLAAPTSLFAASLAGLNVLTGPASFGPDGLPGIAVGERGRLASAAPGEGMRSGDPVTLMFPPEAVALHADPPSGSPRGVVQCTVEAADADAGLVTVRARLDGGAAIDVRVTAAGWAALRLGVGDAAWCSVKATQVRIATPRRSPADVGAPR